MRIRAATENDFDPLYKIGLETPEFRVSSSGAFMEPDEFLSAIRNPDGVFLLAESNGECAGFIYANRQDIERAPGTAWACLVYLVVAPAYRKRGIAQALYAECAQKLKESGTRHVYGWASANGNGGILRFMEKNGFQKGHTYTWMDKEL